MSLRVAVVGAGAIGLYYGAKLAHAGGDVHFLMRGALDEIRRDGITVRGEGENFTVAKANCSNSTADIGPCDLVLIAVKTTSNNDIVELIPPLLHEGTMLMTLQNGLGNEEFLARHFGKERLLAGLCFICLNRISRNVVERFDYGHIVIAEYARPPQARTREIAEMFGQSAIKCSVAEDLTLERWRKLVWNIPFNGLSILAGGLDTAAILADENLRSSTLALMREVIGAANKCGHPLPETTAPEQIRRTEEMNAYKPSTLVDFEAGKPLEIDAIWGEPLRRAMAAGAKVPQLKIVHALLNSIDQVRRAGPAGRPLS